MKQTSFFLLLFSLCFFACTKVSQFSPNAESVNPVPSSTGAKQYPSTGPCPMPGPASLSVTSPSQPGPLQQFNITWSTIPGVTGYVVKVLNQNTNALVYCMEVPPVAGPFESHLTGANAQNPGFGGFSPFVSYTVMVYSSCKSNPGNCNDDLGGVNVINSVIITGGAASIVIEDVEKSAYNGAIIPLDGSPGPKISLISCQAVNIPAPSTIGPQVTSIATSFYNSTITLARLGTMNFINMVSTKTTTDKIKLNIPSAGVDSYLAVYTYPNSSSATCASIPASSPVPTWKLFQFKTAGAIALDVDFTKQYRFRLFNPNLPSLLAGQAVSVPSAGNNLVVIDCPALQN